ncbi:MAG: zinc-binding alcohol dehydrogenase [Flavobacterium sp.]|nr:zinc-binding alcohol dehydrogenase [Flavobacterium sp.]
MEVKSLWHTDEKSSEIRCDSLLIKDAPDAIKVLSGYSAISFGTEKLVATGKVPFELHEKMKVPYMLGDFSFPLKYGYSLVGKTQDNQWVHLMHPHQNCCMVTKPEAYFLSENIDPKTATQLSNMETVLNAIWISKVQSGDSVLVCGLGSIGILLAQTLKQYIGANVSVLETNPVKKEALRNWGFDLCDGTKDYTVCYNVSAHQDGLQYCIDHTITEGKIIELSWYGTQAVTLKLGTHFHYKRLQLISAQVAEIPIAFRDQHTFLSRKKLAEMLLEQIDYAKFITRLVHFDELPAFFDDLRSGKPNHDFITIVKY